MSKMFEFDVFLSHCSKDKDAVRSTAERLRNDGLRVWFDEWEIKPGDCIPAKIDEGLECSRVLLLFMSANTFGSDWALLESGTFRFRDPLNKERRFIPLRLDDAPIKGSLAQFLYIDWQPERREQEYANLRKACLPEKDQPAQDLRQVQDGLLRKFLSLGHEVGVRFVGLGPDDPHPIEVRSDAVLSVGWSPDGVHVVSGGDDNTVRLWDIETGRCLRVLRGHTDSIWSVSFSPDGRRVLSGALDHTVRLWEVETGRCLRLLEGHAGGVWGVGWSPDGMHVVSGGDDNTVRLWEIETGRCLRVLEGHTSRVWSATISPDGVRVLSGSNDNTVRLWEIETGRCLRVLEGHTGSVLSVGWSPDGMHVVSGGDDNTVRLWEIETGRCLRVLEGHTASIWSVVFSPDGALVISGSSDKTVRLWNVNTGRCLCKLEGHSGSVRRVAWTAEGHAFSSTTDGEMREWDLSEFVADRHTIGISSTVSLAPDQVQYTNAKVLLVGDSGAGKTGLAHRLATGEWKPSDGSTIGAWSTQWALSKASGTVDLDQDIWLWDFGGQADQRLVHQLFFDGAALILLLFDADKEEVLPSLRGWQTALRRNKDTETPWLLVAGRTDAGFKASRAKLQSFSQENHIGYFETSAKEGTGCDALSRAINDSIPWAQMEKWTSPRIFKLVKDHILKLRDEGRVLHTFKELREVLWQRLPEESRISDETLQTVIGLLDGPGIVKALDYGTYILLQPEWINFYMQAVIRTLRQDPSKLGCIPSRSIAEGRLAFQTEECDNSIVDTKRLPEAEERVVLGEMERQLEERGLCLRQGDKLVFPGHCGCDRPELAEHPSVFVSYRVTGYLDDIYTTLVVKLADSDSFRRGELWRDAADFVTLYGENHMGIKLTRLAMNSGDNSGDIDVFFGPRVPEQEQVIFANYIHEHLLYKCEQVQRHRYYVCPYCQTPKGNPDVLKEKLLERGIDATVTCDKCDQPISLWDGLEMLHASDEVRQIVAEMQAVDTRRLDSRRQGKLLALEVSARITSADQKCFEIPATEDEGIDMELEFTDDEGKGSGKRIYLQLKSGNSHLKRQKSGAEIFAIREQRWVDYWLKQPSPVMLVIGTFSENNVLSAGKEKLEFAEVRWMEISSYLKRESDNGKKQVKQIVFQGTKLDAMSIRQWREKVLAEH